MGDAFMLHRVKTRIPKFTYTGNYQFVDDGSGNWRIKFLSGGTLTFQSLGNARKGIDVFLVGGGGGGASHGTGGTFGYAGGGAGYTRTQSGVSVAKGTGYGITIGAGGKNNAGSGTSDAGRNTWHYGNDGGASSAFGYSAAGGKGANVGTNNRIDYGGDMEVTSTGGNGGSGGGAAAMYYDGWAGGANGGNGSTKGNSSIWHSIAGAGQGTTTREFGESGGTLYASGGGAGGSLVNNSGNGGKDNLYGSSGIVVIRNHR